MQHHWKSEKSYPALMKPFQGTVVVLDERSLNLFIKDKVSAVARTLGSTVATDRSMVITSRQFSRFATSKPDLYMFSQKHDCGFKNESGSSFIGISHNG